MDLKHFDSCTYIIIYIVKKKTKPKHRLKTFKAYLRLLKTFFNEIE